MVFRQFLWFSKQAFFFKVAMALNLMKFLICCTLIAVVTVYINWSLCFDCMSIFQIGGSNFIGLVLWKNEKIWLKTSIRSNYRAAIWLSNDNRILNSTHQLNLFVVYRSLLCAFQVLAYPSLRYWLKISGSNDKPFNHFLLCFLQYQGWAKCWEYSETMWTCLSRPSDITHFQRKLRECSK